LSLKRRRALREQFGQAHLQRRRVGRVVDSSEDAVAVQLFDSLSRIFYQVNSFIAEFLGETECFYLLGIDD
jgi:hypothetical protein